jgi:pyruvate kinase
LPIYALSRHQDTLNMMTLYRGVKPVFFDSSDSEPGHLKQDVIDVLKAKNIVSSGDLFVLTYGDEMETVGSTNSLKIVTVP